MKILWIIDNKLRELWGIHDIKKILKKSNIELVLCNKFNWNLAINYFDPDLLILPNVREGSPFKNTVKIASNKNIKCILYRSEGLNYDENYMLRQLPFDMLDKITKMFLWSDLEGKVPIKNGYENKTVTVGGLRFVFNKQNKEIKNINTIGIPTSGRYSMNFLDNNIARYIFTRTLKNADLSIGIINNEIQFFICISEILKFLKNDNFKFIIKPHPFENIELYKKAFHNIDKDINIEIEDDPDIRVFLNKTDVLLNQYSSANIHAIKAGVPVLNITQLIPWDHRLKKIFVDYMPSNLGILIKDKEDIRKYLTASSPKKMLEEIENKGDLEIIEKLSPRLDTVKLFSDELVKLSKDAKKRKRNIFFKFLDCIKYYMKEFYIILFEKRKTLYHEIKFSDRNLLKKFSLSKNN